MRVMELWEIGHHKNVQLERTGFYFHRFIHITLGSLGIRRAGYVIAMAADVLAQNMHQAISNHHADSTVNILSQI